MKLLAIGVDHHSAPTALRELLAMEGARRDQGLDALRRHLPGCECVILSTCNRVELFVASGNLEDAPEAEELNRFLAEFHNLDTASVAAHLVAHHDEAVIGHLFRVTASLESLVLGEGQILGQVRDAYQAAVARGTVGPLFHSIFQRALRVGKLVREQTGMDKGRLSIASVAVDVAREVFDTFSDKTVLILGAGKMAELTLQHLSSLRPGRVLICNRNFERAREAANKRQAQAVPIERLDEALIEADLVVSTTAAEQPIVKYDRYARLQRRERAGRLALILDIAVPRDFEPRIGELDQVLLYNLDDLQAQVDRNRSQRKSQFEPAQALVERELATYLAELRHQRLAGTLLRQLGDYGDAIGARELERFFTACPDLTETQRDAAKLLVHRLKNQFLHHPRQAMRSLSEAGSATESSGTPGDPNPILNVVKQLFGLGDPQPAEHPKR